MSDEEGRWRGGRSERGPETQAGESTLDHREPTRISGGRWASLNVGRARTGPSMVLMRKDERRRRREKGWRRRKKSENEEMGAGLCLVVVWKEVIPRETEMRI